MEFLCYTVPLHIYSPFFLFIRRLMYFHFHISFLALNLLSFTFLKLSFFCNVFPSASPFFLLFRINFLVFNDVVSDTELPLA